METTTKTVKTTARITMQNPNKTKKQGKTFQDLGTWKAAQELAVAVLRQCEGFVEPGAALSNLMTEVATDICTNIAQGFNEFESDARDCFYQAALNLIVRLENYLLIAESVGYLNPAQQDDLARRCNNVRFILIKLRKLNLDWDKQRAY